MLMWSLTLTFTVTVCIKLPFTLTYNFAVIFALLNKCVILNMILQVLFSFFSVLGIVHGRFFATEKKSTISAIISNAVLVQ